jgi:hypothetical protein
VPLHEFIDHPSSGSSSTPSDSSEPVTELRKSRNL